MVVMHMVLLVSGREVAFSLSVIHLRNIIFMLYFWLFLHVEEGFRFTYFDSNHLKHFLMVFLQVEVFCILFLLV